MDHFVCSTFLTPRGGVNRGVVIFCIAEILNERAHEHEPRNWDWNQAVKIKRKTKQFAAYLVGGKGKHSSEGLWLRKIILVGMLASLKEEKTTTILTQYQGQNKVHAFYLRK